MQGKVVLVTGANGGLGMYVTQAFLDAGATVIGTSRKIQQSDFSSPSFTAEPAEISSREGTKVLVDRVVARFGRIDVLAHTLGGFAGGQSIADTDDETFQADVRPESEFCISHSTRDDPSSAADGQRPYYCDWESRGTRARSWSRC